MEAKHRRHFIPIIVYVFSVIIAPTICQGYILKKNDDKKDVIDIISEKHIEIARCRLFCIKEFMGPRLLYQDINTVSYECKNTSISCNHCYEMCEKISHNKKEETMICNYDNHMCFGGCRTACKHRFLSNKNMYIQNIIDRGRLSPPEIVVKDCILYWHFYETKPSETNLVMYQIYGKDASDTWFDLGQTTQSYFESLPSLLDKCKTIRILSIDRYTTYKVDYNLDIDIKKDTCYLEKANQLNRLEDDVGMKPLINSPLEKRNHETLSNFTLKVIIALILCFITCIMISLCIILYRNRCSQNNKLNSSHGTTANENSYEEINAPNPDSSIFGVYNVKSGRVTSLRNNDYSDTTLAVALPNKQISGDQANARNYCLKNAEERNNYAKKENMSNLDGQNTGKHFVDVVSWLQTVNSEMRFDNFGFKNDDNETPSNSNFYPLKYFHVAMSTQL